MRKNIVIAMLIFIIVGLSLVLYRTTRASRILATEMAATLEKQNQMCHDFASQVRWLRRHLEKTLSVLEAERNLEPIPLQFPYDLPDKKISPSEYSMEPDSFVIPYQKPEHRLFGTSPNAVGLCRLMGQINLSSGSILFMSANANMEILIDNLYQRLQRLEPEIEKN